MSTTTIKHLKGFGATFGAAALAFYLCRELGKALSHIDFQESLLEQYRAERPEGPDDELLDDFTKRQARQFARALKDEGLVITEAPS